MRIDKFLANMGVGTRTEVKQLLKKGNVTVNDKKEKSPKTQINPDTDTVSVNETQIQYIDKIYLMLNKPKGYLSATEDNNQQTVIDLVEEFRYLELFPVGRLIKILKGYCSSLMMGSLTIN